MKPILMQGGGFEPAEYAKLMPLLSQDNKLLAVQAFRELLAGKQMPVATAREQLAHAGGKLLALYVYLLLTLPAPDSGQPLMNGEVAALIKRTRDLDELRSVALGAFAAILFQPNAQHSFSSAKSLLTMIRQRLVEMNIDVKQEAYLAAILEKTGA